MKEFKKAKSIRFCNKNQLNILILKPNFKGIDLKKDLKKIKRQLKDLVQPDHLSSFAMHANKVAFTTQKPLKLEKLEKISESISEEIIIKTGAGKLYPNVAYCCNPCFAWLFQKKYAQKKIKEALLDAISWCQEETITFENGHLIFFTTKPLDEMEAVFFREDLGALLPKLNDGDYLEDACLNWLTDREMKFFFRDLDGSKYGLKEEDAGGLFFCHQIV